MKKATERKKFKMKKSVRLTIAGALAVTALVVALIPTKGVQAFDPEADRDTDIPTTIDEAIAVDSFVKDNGITPNINGTKYWAFPCGESEIITDKNGIKHTYYHINRDGMTPGYDVMPVFEITTATKPSTTETSCISCYVGGDGSGYAPSGGVLKLSPTVIYAKAGETGETYETVYENPDESVRENSVWTRYTEILIEHEPNDVMRDAYTRGPYAGSGKTPDPYYYYNVKVETWSIPWTSEDDGAGNITWKKPEKPEFDNTSDPKYVAPQIEYIDDVCRKKDGSNLGYQIVSYIADEAFKGVANFSTMEVLSEDNGSGKTNGIVQIGNSAFENCFNLKEVAFGTIFEKLGSKAFCNCTALQSVDFNMTTSIGDGAFANCSTLPSVSLPVGLTELGTGAFYGCSSLIDQIPDYRTTEDDEKNSYLFGGIKSDTPLTVGSYAFCNCTNLRQTKMARSTQPLTTHGKYGMYAGCTSLEQIELPSQTGSFKTTPTMFMNCPQLKCVRANNNSDTATDRQFINTLNQGVGETINVSEDFVLWGPNPGSNPALYNFAKTNSLPYMYYDSAEGKFKYIMVLEDTYRFTFTDDFIVQKIDQISSTPTEKNATLTIPATIGGHPIQAIADNACGQVSGTTYVSNLTLPKTIKISDAIATIGENAFRNCKSVEEVDFIHIPFTTAAAQTSIGTSCFEDCKKLSVIKFRDDSFDGSEYYDINIDDSTVGAKAFLTQNPNGMTMVGKMEPGYWPYDYALNPENISCSSVADSYITYKSGNPQNLTCRYTRPDSSKPGYVTLLDYPTVNTVVGKEDDGTGHLQDITIGDLISRYYAGSPALSVNQEQIINQYTRDIEVPGGITSILKAKNNLGDVTNPDGYDNDYFIHTNDYKTGHNYNLGTLVFDSLSSLPDVSTEACEGGGSFKPFAQCEGLSSIIFNDNITDLGELPFYNFPVTDDGLGHKIEDLNNPPLATLSNVQFNGENDKSSATEEDPYYWCTNGIIYKYYKDGDGIPHTTIVEVLQGRGYTVGEPQVSLENDPDLVDVTDINDKAFKHCDYISSVDLSASKNLENIPVECFYNCNQLRQITLPDSVNTVESKAFAENNGDTKVLQDVYFYSTGIDVDEDAFTHTYGTYCHGYADSSIKPYVDNVNKKESRSAADKLIFDQMTEPIYYTITFMDHLDMKELYTKTVKPGEDVATPDPPKHDGYDFTEWYSDPPKAWLNVQKSATVWARYTPTSTSSSSSSSSSSSKSTSSSGSSSSSSKSTSTSSSSKVSTSITSTTVQPVIISGTGTLVGSATSLKAAGNGTNTGSGNAGSTGSTGSTGGGNGSNVGKTKLISTTGGISDPSKMSATVNGSSDNYVIKISETDEANSMADQALTAAFGSLENIRYMPFDISLYDSTGNQKISPVPDGVSINITMPIPDKLAIYGGNAKVASTESGTLEKIPPKFTLINGVPCMNFTVTHLSPYVVYVDTANLTAIGTLDSTPKTADPIHPKWFLVIGLAAISGILFLKRDKKETFEAA